METFLGPIVARVNLGLNVGLAVLNWYRCPVNMGVLEAKELFLTGGTILGKRGYKLAFGEEQ